MYLEEDISLIVPCFNHQNEVVKLLEYLDKKKIFFGEILVIDSTNVKLNLSKENFLNKIKYIYEKNCLPGKARNIGVKNSKGKILAFLDCNTTPEISWTYEYLNILNCNSISSILGKCKAIHNNNFNYVLRASSYGDQAFSSLPGTMILKSEFYKVGFFNEYSRAGEDIEWLNRLKKIKYIEIFIFKKNYINYYGLPQNFFSFLRKWIIYSLSSSKLNIYQNQRVLYFIIFFGLVLYNIYYWNTNLGNWDQSRYYINNLTKYFVIISCFIYFIFRSIIRPKIINTEIDLFKNFLFLKIFLISFTIDIIKIPGSLIGIIKNIIKLKI